MACGDPVDPTILHRSNLRGAAFTSSLAEEAPAMQLVLKWTAANHPGIGIQPPLKAIEMRSPVTHYLI